MPTESSYIQKMMATLANNERELQELAEAINNSDEGMGPIWPNLGNRGGVLGTLANFRALLSYGGITIRYNEMTKDIEIDILGVAPHRDRQKSAMMAHLIDLGNRWGFPKNDIPDFVTAVAADNPYHPVRDWIESQPWDGVSRLNLFYDAVVLRESNPLKETLMRKWALSAVAALYHPEFSSEGVLTLSGPQGIGKTSFILTVVGTQQRSSVLTGTILNLDNKDSLTKAITSWITELGELDATFKKSQIESLKAFLTNDKDRIRLPYARTYDDFHRNTVFYATVNGREFLRDDQNRRFWVLGVERFRLPTAEQGWVAQQFWAEMATEYHRVRGLIGTAQQREANQEWGWFLSPEERRTLQNSQRDFRDEDTIEELLQNRLVPPGRVVAGEYLNATGVLMRILNQVPNNSQKRAAAKWMRDQGYVERRDSKSFLVEIETNDDQGTLAADQTAILSAKIRGFGGRE